ncbi:MAG: ABC transporter ATP-binding protein [Anaerococcus sp.]|nr:ABC transporter ATP-binding protein [Anaerococcus sp.]
MNKKISDFSNIKILVKTIYKINKFYIPAFLLQDLAKAMETVVNIYLPMLFINSLEKAWPKDKVFKLVFCLIILKLFLKTFGYIMERWKNIQIETLNMAFPQVLAKKTMEMPYENLEDPKILDLKERALFPITSFGALYNFIEDASLIAREIFTLLASFSIVFVFSKALLVLSIVISTITIAIDKKMSQKQLKYQQDLIPINRKYGYYINLMSSPTYQKEIRIFQMNKILLKKANDYINHICAGFEKMYIEVANTFSISIGLQTLIRFISYSYVGMRAFSDKFGPKIGLGQFALLVSANENLVSSYKSIVSSYLDIKIDMGHLRPFSEFLLLETKQKAYGKETIGEFKSLVFDHVTFSYPKTDRKILDNICFTINKGEKISIVGLNNAGKTTIIKLICRFFRPDSGQILINGKDIQSYDKTSYNKLISAVFQDFSLFPMTIGENIVANLNYNRDKLKAIGQSLKIDEFIEKLEKGYDTNLYKDIYQNAVDLSGGQKQKIAIARALYRSGHLVILDEPTASLDPLAEAAIYENFHSLTYKKTALYISHRMSSSKFCDKILLIDNGKISGFASHEAMMKSNKLYQKLYNTQAKYFAQ